MAKTTIPGGYIETGSIDTASLADTSITADKLHTTLDLTGKAVTVATATAGDNDTTVASTAFVSTAIATTLPLAGGTMTGTIAGFTSTGIDDNATSTAITIDSSENVGIGTTSPGEKLSILGGHISVGDSTGVAGTEFLLEGYREIYNSAKYGNTSIRTTYDIASNASDMLFYTASGGTNTAEAMRIDSGGNVGINTSSPDTLLTVGDFGDTARAAAFHGGSILVDGGAASEIIIGDGNVAYMSIQTTDDATAMNIRNFSGSSDLVTIERASGNVGIGTPNPSTRTHIYSSASSTPLIVESTGNTYVGIKNTTQTAYIGAVTSNMIFENNGTERMRIDSSGRIGITVVPETDWHVDRPPLQIGNNGSISSKSTSANAQMSVNANAKQIATSNATGWKYIDSEYASQHFQFNGEHQFRVAPSGTADAAITWTNAMVIDNSGNVGIGTSSPSSTLDVKRDTNTVNNLDSLGFDVAALIGNAGSNPGNHYSSGLRIYQGSGTVGSGLGVFHLGADNGTATAANRYTAQIIAPSGMTGGIKLSALDSAGAIQFNTGGYNERMSIESDGHLKIASFSSNADNTDTDTHRKTEIAANGSGQAIYKRDCFVQQATGNTQYHWYKIFIGSDSYARGVNIKYTVNWSSEHATGQGIADGSLITRSNHATSQVDVHGHIVYSRQYVSGTYYGWTDNPDVTIYKSSASGTSAGLYMRIEGYRSSGYDGGVVHAIYLEIFGSEQDISNQGIYYTGSSTPSDIGAAVSRTVLS
jgi:hypothetical protein